MLQYDAVRCTIDMGVIAMTDEQLLKKIAVNAKVMLGKPVIKGTRLTVEYILDRLAHGATAADLVDEYVGVTLDDIAACLLFAKKSLSDTDYMPPIAKFEIRNPKHETSGKSKRRSAENVWGIYL